MSKLSSLRCLRPRVNTDAVITQRGGRLGHGLGSWLGYWLRCRLEDWLGHWLGHRHLLGGRLSL